MTLKDVIESKGKNFHKGSFLFFIIIFFQWSLLWFSLSNLLLYCLVFPQNQEFIPKPFRVNLFLACVFLSPAKSSIAGSPQCITKMKIIIDIHGVGFIFYMSVCYLLIMGWLYFMLTKQLSSNIQYVQTIYTRCFYPQ